MNNRHISALLIHKKSYPVVIKQSRGQKCLTRTNVQQNKKAMRHRIKLKVKKWTKGEKRNTGD